MPDQNERLGGDHAPPSTSAVATRKKPCTYLYIRVSTVHRILSTLSEVWMALCETRSHLARHQSLQITTLSPARGELQFQQKKDVLGKL